MTTAFKIGITKLQKVSIWLYISIQNICCPVPGVQQRDIFDCFHISRSDPTRNVNHQKLLGICLWEMITSILQSQDSCRFSERFILEFRYVCLSKMNMQISFVCLYPLLDTIMLLHKEVLYNKQLAGKGKVWSYGQKEEFRLVNHYCAVNINSSTLSGIGSSGHMNPRLARILVCCNAIMMD